MPQPPKPAPQILSVSVSAPRSPDPKVFRWDKHLNVGTAAAEAAAAFGYSGGTPSLSENDKVLDPTKQLVAAGVKDGDKLDLLDAGGGV
jgi:hypothetical protein